CASRGAVSATVEFCPDTGCYHW
nr:immunoglobulin heavy chain junction region [Macaca mulatta]MOW21715.1 immunoglobulin heavy chain junction region [Macaca mulatta]